MGSYICIFVPGKKPMFKQWRGKGVSKARIGGASTHIALENMSASSFDCGGLLCIAIHL